MRRVLHAVARFLPRSETFIYTVVTHHREYEATVLTQERIFDEEFPFPRVRVCPKPVTKRSIGWWLDAAAARTTGRSRWRRSVEAVLADVRPDVVHAHFGPTACDLVDIVRDAGVPLVTSLYGVDAAVLPYLPQWRDAYARLFRDGDLFLAEGPAMREKVIAAGAPRARTAMQPIAIDVSRYPRWTPADSHQVLFAGRFIEKKGLLDAIAAFDEARRRVPSAHLTIVGDGPDEDAARGLVDRLAVGAAVTFAGSKPHAELIRMLAAASVLIHPSAVATDGDSEGGAPTILLEAQAVGVPIVTTRHADIPFVAPPSAGVRHCEEHDVRALGAALADLLLAPAPSSRAQVAAQHDVSRLIPELEALYTGVGVGSAHA